MDINEAISIMITGIGGYGHQILKALRLSQIPYWIVGGDITPLSPGLYQVDKPVLLPRANDPDYIKAVLELCGRFHTKVLFVGSEPELKIISKHRRTFQDMGIFLPINTPQTLDICLDKAKTMEWLQLNGFPCPKTTIINNINEIPNILFFPVVLKPIKDTGGSVDVFVARDENELSHLTNYLLLKQTCIMAQEYVGSYDEEYTVGILSDMEGAIINSIVMKRQILLGLSNRYRVLNNTPKAELGEILAISNGISQGYVDNYPDIALFCEKVASKMGSCGPLNIQCRVHNNEIKVFEINPRFSGTTSIRALAGFNEPDLLVRKYVLGQEILRHFDYKQGLAIRSLNEHFIEEDKILRS